MTDILTPRALNRATLARQMLLDREKTTVLRAVERLAGLQAQLARPPFIGLWSRLDGFRAEDLTRPVHARKIVRATLMRGTLHLVTTKDYRALRPLFQPMLGLADTFEALRPKLRVFRDERGRELFDLLKAPRPPADTPAPVRFLPDYDNLLLAHADRTRVIADAHRSKVSTANLRTLATFLVDGLVAGTWRIERKRASATLIIEPFATVSRKTRAELVEEGEALARFAEPDARTAEVRFG